MKIAIIGAGWYGCHFARNLLKTDSQVDIFEKHNDVFGCASGNNQNRLHRGFHYPRSHITRAQSNDGYTKFLKEYPDLVKTVENNIYAIAKRKSILDYPTYIQILKAEGLRFVEVEPSDFGLQEIEGALVCDEKLILTSTAKSFFKQELGACLKLSESVNSVILNPDSVMVNGERYDIAINCTWGTYDYRMNLQIYYEPVVSLIYKSNLKDFALTVVDGQFFSIYPYQNGTYTVTSVTHTPTGKYFDYESAEKHLATIDSSYVEHIRTQIEEQIAYIYPSFHDNFKFLDYQRSLKTKIVDNSDSREFVIEQSGRIINVLSGKIDAIFGAWSQLEKLIDIYNTSTNNLD